MSAAAAEKADTPSFYEHFRNPLHQQSFLAPITLHFPCPDEMMGTLKTLAGRASTGIIVNNPQTRHLVARVVNTHLLLGGMSLSGLSTPGNLTVTPDLTSPDQMTFAIASNSPLTLTARDDRLETTLSDLYRALLLNQKQPITIRPGKQLFILNIPKERVLDILKDQGDAIRRIELLLSENRERGFPIFLSTKGSLSLKGVQVGANSGLIITAIDHPLTFSIPT